MCPEIEPAFVNCPYCGFDTPSPPGLDEENRCRDCRLNGTPQDHHKHFTPKEKGWA